MTPWTVHFSFLGFEYATHEDGGYMLTFNAGRFNWGIGIDPDFSRSSRGD